MGEDGGQTVPQWLIIATLATNVGFLVAFGAGFLNSQDIGSCDGLTSCVSAAFSAIGVIFQLIFTSAFSVNLPIEVALILFFLVNVPWIVIAFGFVVRGLEAIIP